MPEKKSITRRAFLGTATAASSLTILPRRVLGGPGYVAPSDKINFALIGSGTMAIKMLMSDWLPRDDMQITCIADPNKDSDDYRDWSQHGMRDRVREFIQKPNWGSENGIRAGRDAGKEIVDTYYANIRGMTDYKGCNTYTDYRELLEKEEGIDAIICMTPEHLHAAVCIAAMKKGKHAISHKTLSNVLHEVRLAADTARETGLVTHLLAWNNDTELYDLRDWLRAGVIGKVKEVHNWSARPVWPQGWLSYPEEEMKVPKGMDWDLWLGPVPDMPYHLDLTHALFRGWYNFGSGCLGDMGNYSLQRVYRMLNPGPPLAVTARSTHGCRIIGNQSRPVRSEVAFPNASTIHFKHEDLDIYWYDGGMQPNTPQELLDDGEAFEREGMLFVGEYGKILGSFHGRNFRVIPKRRMKAFEGLRLKMRKDVISSTDEYITAIRDGRQSGGSFQNFQELAEATCLGNLAIRMNQRLEWDSENMRVTNVEEANKYLRREYRPGWEL